MKPLTAIRVLALACVALALMCASLAVAWRTERDRAACWRTAAEFQLPPNECHG